MLNEDEIDLLNQIEGDISLQNYFFKKVKDLKWFFPLRDREYFKPSNLPKPDSAQEGDYRYTPRWNVLSYLEEVSKQVGSKDNDIYINELLDIIKSITEFQREKKYEIDDWTWLTFTRILLNIPNDRIPLEIIKSVKIWLSKERHLSLLNHEIFKLISKFLPEDDTPEDIKKAEALIQFVTQIKWIKHKRIRSKEFEEIFGREKDEAKTVIDCYWLLEGFKDISGKVAEKCSNRPILLVADRLIKIFKQTVAEPENDYSYIWFKSLHHEPDLPPHRAEDTLSIILRDLLFHKAKSDQKSTKEILEKFLSEDYPQPLFKRMVLYVVSEYWNKYKSYFWRIQEAINVFEEHPLESELYILLQKNVHSFNDEEKKKIKTSIEKSTRIFKSSKNKQFKINYRKQFWLSALKEDPIFRKEYNELKKLTKTEEDVSFKSTNVMYGFGSSPLTAKQILERSNEKVGLFLQRFKTANKWDGPSVESLANNLRQAVSERPSKFTKNLKPFLKTGYLYVYNIICGFGDAWKHNKEIEWDKVLKFVILYLDLPGFWENKFVLDEEWQANHRWVVGQVAELIQEGTRNDDHSFSIELNSDAYQILFEIIDNYRPEKDEIMNDPLTHTLNSAIGKTFVALLYTVLREARLKYGDKAKTKIKWTKEIRQRFDYAFSNKIMEGYVVFGEYMPNFNYLDQTWVKTNIKKFEKLKQDNLWSSFMTGYLYLSRVYKDLFLLMKPHYERALDYPFKDSYSQEGLIQHLCVVFLNDYDKDDPLLIKLIKKWNYDQIFKIIGFFSHQEEFFVSTKDVQDSDIRQRNDNLVSKVKVLWKLIFDICNHKGIDEQEKMILSETSKLAVFLQAIDEENYVWLKLAARYAQLNYNATYFIKYLDDLQSKGDSIQSTRYAGKLFLEMLSLYIPDYKEEHIISIVESLYKSKDSENRGIADKICEIYGRSGREELLREVYSKYH